MANDPNYHITDDLLPEGRTIKDVHWQRSTIKLSNLVSSAVSRVYPRAAVEFNFREDGEGGVYLSSYGPAGSFPTDPAEEARLEAQIQYLHNAVVADRDSWIVYKDETL